MLQALACHAVAAPMLQTLAWESYAANYRLKWGVMPLEINCVGKPRSAAAGAAAGAARAAGPSACG